MTIPVTNMYVVQRALYLKKTSDLMHKLDRLLGVVCNTAVFESLWDSVLSNDVNFIGRIIDAVGYFQPNIHTEKWSNKIISKRIPPGELNHEIDWRPEWDKGVSRPRESFKPILSPVVVVMLSDEGVQKLNKIRKKYLEI